MRETPCEGYGQIRGVNEDGHGVIGRPGNYDVTFAEEDYEGDLPLPTQP